MEEEDKVKCSEKGVENTEKVDKWLNITLNIKNYILAGYILKILNRIQFFDYFYYINIDYSLHSNTSSMSLSNS